MGIVYSPDAIDSIQRIVDYFYDLGAFKKAKQIADGIFEVVDRLANQPQMGKVETNMTFREFTIRSVLCCFRLIIAFITDLTGMISAC